MGLQADPAPTLFSDGRLAARGGDPTFLGCWRFTCLKADPASHRRKAVYEELIEAVARKAKGRTGQGFIPKFSVAPENLEPGRATCSRLGQNFLWNQRT